MQIANCLGVFPGKTLLSLASFAITVSPVRSYAGPCSNYAHPVGSTATTQGRLRCTQLFTTCRFIPQAIVVALNNSHALGPPRGWGQRPHALVGRPTPLTPSTDPRLGVSSQHQELHWCALDGFLGPPSGKVALTRIQRHLPLSRITVSLQYYSMLFNKVANIIPLNLYDQGKSPAFYQF